LSRLKAIIEELGGKDKLTLALKENLKWIYASFKTNGYKGSSGSRSVLGKWESPYPETTGYLIPTLIAGHPYVPELGLLSLAKKQIPFFKNLRTAEGGFYSDAKNSAPIVFDTAQILLGLISLVPEVTEPDLLLDEIAITRQWLRDLLDEEGNFISHNYVLQYQPAYYSRIGWPLAFAENIIDSKPSTATKMLIHRITSSQNENHSFPNWGFYKGENAYTHTLAYTLRGLWEYAELVNSKKIKKQVKQSLHKLHQTISSEGCIAGSYDENWEGDYSFICSTGNAQLALLNLLVFERTGQKIFLDHISDLISPLLKAQRKVSLNKGAVPSSLPIWGPYQRMKFTNWTQKFFADVLMKLLALSDD